MKTRSTCLFLVAALLAGLPSRAVRAGEVGGIISVDTTWTAAGNPWVVTATVTVVGSATLTLEAGVQVELDPQLSLLAESGGGIEVWGDAGNPVLFRSRVPGENWARIGAQGNGSHLTLRHADLASGQGAVLDGASGHIERCFFHDYHAASGSPSLSLPILVSNHAASILVRASHFRNYYETNFRNGVITVEDSLFEEVSGDAIDFDVAEPGSIIRRCTFRHGAATNVDAVDLGSDTQGTEISHCLIYDFPFDKGVSIGEKSSNIVVRACVMYGVDTGVAVKDSSQALIVNNTIVGADYALRLYQKVAGQGPGYATAWNNILWTNTTVAELLNGSILNLAYSDVQGGYAGDGNLSADPMFRNAASNDFRLAAGSPCIGTGTNQTTMGALFPVGSFLVDTDSDGLPDTWETTYGLDFNDPADGGEDPDADGMSNVEEFVAGTAPDNPGSAFTLTAAILEAEGASLWFHAVEDKTYTLQFRDTLEASEWQWLSTIPAQSAPTNLMVNDPARAPTGHRFYRLVTPALDP